MAVPQLKKQNEVNPEKGFKLFITKESDNTISLRSTDKHFTSDDYLNYGKNYKLTDAYFKNADSNEIRRKPGKGESAISNQTLLRLASQVFEDDLARLSDDDKKSFPVYKNSQTGDETKGFSDFEDKVKNRTIYKRNNGDGQFVFTYTSSYSSNIFSTIVFAQECLRRFGRSGDQFVLAYRKENDRTTADEKQEADAQEKLAQGLEVYLNPFSPMLIESKNLIFRGAPGTGKSYLAKTIAADIISKGFTTDYSVLTPEQKKQVEFVQFHPSYDYTDFVEGLRPKLNDDGTMGFELRDGIFKRFVDRARKNYEDSQKSIENAEKEITVQESMAEFFSGVEFGVDTFKTIKENEFIITGVDDRHIYIFIPGNASANRLVLNIDEVRKMLESGRNFERIKDVTSFFEKTFATQEHSYDFAIYKAIKAQKSTVSKANAKQEELKKYIFIIDEINRGEISKIFGELFFSIDPCYRGKAGEVSTQYSNLHSDPDEKFYIPENVYIIGTMNDIDRSVDSFDFAMRRRFRFVELKADDFTGALDAMKDGQLKEEAKKRMAALNKAIVEVEGLNENYQIGAAYFRKLETLGFDRLWSDYLQPLLQEYVRGMYNEEEIMKSFEKAYGYSESAKGDANEAAQNQG